MYSRYDYIINKNQIPKLAANTNLQFREIPECLLKLTPLERIMCAPYIAFIKITELIPSMLNSQLCSKGGIVNIPVEINTMLKVLPRNFNDMCLIQLALKRNLKYKTSYKCETISPARVCDALKYLIQTPLYVENDIKIDEEYFNRYDQNYDEMINFIIDEGDIKIVEENMNSLKKHLRNLEVQKMMIATMKKLFVTMK